MTHTLHVYRNGLEELASSLSGTERIYAGIRPYGYHAGNRIVLAVYPHLLARMLAARGVEPRFEYVVTLNDVEPRAYDYGSFQPVGPVGDDAEIAKTVDTLEADLVRLRAEFPSVSIRYLRSSEIFETPLFDRCGKILSGATALETFLTEDLMSQITFEGGEFSGLACVACGITTRLHPGAPCTACGSPLATEPRSRAFWMHYVPLISMKLAHIEPDVAILGGDYLDTADELLLFMRHQNMLEAIWAFYDLIASRRLTMLCSPVLLGPDGRKMSKSLGNLQEFSYEEVFTACASGAGRSVAVVPVAVDDSPTALHPLIRSVAEGRREVTKPAQEQTAEGIAERRQVQPDLLAVPDPVGVVTETRLVPGPGGDLLVRLHIPDGRSSDAAVMFVHGGGWVWGHPQSYDAYCRHLAAELSCLVVASSYRFAPEHRYPAALDDTITAFRWLHDHAADLAIAPDRIAIGGCSSGGNLAAATVLRLRDLAGPRPAAQLLLYPVLDAPDSWPSYQEDHGPADLMPEEMRWFADQYAPGADRDDPYLFPLRAPSLAGLPSTIILAARHDPLRDEAAAFADRLRADGVHCDHICYGSLGHTFLSYARAVPAARHAVDDSVRLLRAALTS